MFGFLTRRKKAPSPKPPVRKVCLGLEALETRESPATLSFVSSAAVLGGAALNGSWRTGVRYLQNFNSGDVAKVTSGWNSAYASLSNHSGASSYKSVSGTTSALAYSSARSAEATLQTTQDGNRYQYITVQVNRSLSSERIGQTVRVTLTPSFVSTLGPFNRGTAYNSYSFYVNGTQYMGGTDYSRGTETFSRTITINATIGSTFQIAFRSYSYAAGGSSTGNVATNQFSLGLSV